MAAKRKRPGSDRPNRTVQPNVIYPGCCKPYPDARFVNQKLVELSAHHIGPNCKGYMEPLSVEDWNAEIDARAAIARNDR